ncbi:MAG TPA: TrmH family RNA methyltransferase [Candidatus Lokiarchaeia archaeon]|nr:TrmH family RNA methyltransferase [Candidatus Lokiarchaeia archaeon]
MLKAICMTGCKYVINLLAIMRAADGFGFNDLVLAGDVSLDINLIKKLAKRNLVDLMGGLHLIYLPDIEMVLKFMQDRHYKPVVLETEKGKSIDEFNWPENPIIIIGHEITGVPMQYFEDASLVHVPMVRTATSMNVACAASIAMYALHLAEINRE